MRPNQVPPAPAPRLVVYWGVLVLPFVGWYLIHGVRHGWPGWPMTLLISSYAIAMLPVCFLLRQQTIRWRQIEIHHLHVCPGCEFPLHQLPDPGICPECGRPYTFRELQAYWIDVETRGHEDRKNPFRSRDERESG